MPIWSRLRESKESEATKKEILEKFSAVGHVDFIVFASLEF